MTSLRGRLILAFSLVTIVPLAIAMYLLTERIETMVRAQAAERLSAALRGIQTQVASDAQHVAEKLQILGRDPLLKRLFLLQSGSTRDLSEYLGERRFLLGLDFLSVADTSGSVVAAAAPGEGRPDASGIPAARTGSDGPVIEALPDAPGLAMVARAPIRYQNDIAGFVQGGLMFDAEFLRRLSKAGGVELALRDEESRVGATTLAGLPASALPYHDGVERVELRGRPYLSRSVPLSVGAPPHAILTGLASTAAADRTIASLQIASAILGLLGLGIAALLGIFWSSQISRPVERLAAFSHKLAQGEWEEPLTLHSVRELQTLVAALDRMRKDLQAYRDKLVTSERQAAWSQMARKVAHEVTNPLTPIAISVADLKRSYDQKRADFPEILDQAAQTVAAEVETLRHLLQEFSDFARLPKPELAPCRLSSLMRDLETLYGRDVAAGRLVLPRSGPEVTFPCDHGQMRQALINLIKNGLEALNSDGRVVVSARVDGGVLEIAVSDTGAGLNAEQKANLFVPGFTTKSQGSGLGLTIVQRIVNDHEGTIAVDSGPGSGTTFRIRMPLGPRAEA